MKVEEMRENIDVDDLRLKAGRSIQDWAKLLARLLSPDDAWRLLLVGCLAVMLPLLGDEGAAATFRELADDLEHGREPRVVN